MRWRSRLRVRKAAVLFASFLFAGYMQGQRAPAIDPALDISIVSSKDSSPQRAIFYAPPGAEKVPLVVFLHSWSTDYKTVGQALEESKRRGWNFVGPNL
jgi:hypothetical protein